MKRHSTERKETGLGPNVTGLILFGMTLCFLILFAQKVNAEEHTGASKDSLKIVSFNTWFGMDGHGVLRMGEHEDKQQREKRYRGLVEGLRSYDADIVFLQEANPLPSYARRLAEDLEMDEIHAVNNGGVRIGPAGIPTNLRTGPVILAKPSLKLKKTGTHRTSGSGLVSNFVCFHTSDVREILGGVVYPDGQPLYLFCLHAYAAPPDTDEYRTRLDAILDAEGIESGKRESYAEQLSAGFARTGRDILESMPYIKDVTHGGEPFIVAGDFNAYLPDFHFINEFMQGLRLVDSFALLHPDDPGYTWDPRRNPLTRHDGADTWTNGDPKDPLGRLEADFAGTVPMRIDYIFLSNRFEAGQVLDSQLVFTEPYEDVHVSDHFGVMTEVLLEMRRER
jgi:endonuclease/exonuclease/phosphatase family metal-dependent hydrolase